MVSSALINAIIQQESSGNPRARNKRTGATGLMQIMEATGRQPGYGIRPINDRLDPAENIRFGSEYINALVDKYEGSVPWALAAYNWGPGNVDRHRKRGGNMMSLPRETRNYAMAIMSNIGFAPDYISKFNTSRARQPRQRRGRPMLFGPVEKTSDSRTGSENTNENNELAVQPTPDALEPVMRMADGLSSMTDDQLDAYESYVKAMRKRQKDADDGDNFWQRLAKATDRVAKSMDPGQPPAIRSPQIVSGRGGGGQAVTPNQILPATPMSQAQNIFGPQERLTQSLLGLGLGRRRGGLLA